MADDRKMRGLFILVLLILMSFGYQKAKEMGEYLGRKQYQEEIETMEQVHYISNTASEKCKLCGSGDDTFIHLYLGEENIGIISLNSFEFVPIVINQYDEYGNLIEEKTGRSSMERRNVGENGFSIMVYESPDRGYASCKVYCQKDEVLNIEQAAKHMCANCMRLLTNDDWGSTPTGIAVINFKNGELRLLREDLMAFQFGDYYISCRAIRDEESGNSLEMELSIFYCPERYGD